MNWQQVDWQRNLLIAAMLAVFGVLFVRWIQFQEAHRPPVAGQETAAVIAAERPSSAAVTDTPSTSPDVPGGADQSAPAAPHAASSAALVTVETDVLKVTIDTLGGDIVRVALPQYPVSLQNKGQATVLLNRTDNHLYVAQSGLIGPHGTDTQRGRPAFIAANSSYSLADGKDEVVVDLVVEQGLTTVTKRFVFRRGDYLVDISYLIDNRSAESWQARMYGQIKRDAYNPNPGNFLNPQPFLGAALTTTEKNYRKMSFGDLDDESIKTAKTGGWVAMVQHYFISAWVPDQTQQNNFEVFKQTGQETYLLRFTGPTQEIAPGTKGEIRSAFYVGPKDQYRLEKISPYLDLTVDYGWLWWMAKPLFFGLYFLHELFGNWGWSIILLTVFVKLLLFPLSAASYRSMARMRKLQPEMARLKEECGDDRQKLSQGMMELYKKEKVNPLGGCLPMLVQMPVFLALYWVLNESVELRQAPWLLWIQDLSVQDPWFVLPILNAACMYVLQTLQPAPPDPLQAKVLKFMPIGFSFFFMFFPAGLVLYWTVNSLLSIAQQWTITRKIAP